MLESILFGLFTITAIASAVATVFHRNPVHCALFLVGVLLSMAGMFVLLNAPFIAAIQIVVYAVAIMVLFLFVVMLLNVKGETPLLTRGAAKGFGIFFGLLALVELLWVALAQRRIRRTPVFGHERQPESAAGLAVVLDQPCRHVARSHLAALEPHP